MFYSELLYLSVAIFIIGTLWRIYTWLTVKIGPETDSISVGQRLISTIKGCFKALLSLNLFKLIKIVLLDVILQVKVVRLDFVRWLMHALIFFGFMGLLLMHALDGPITERVFPDYQSTLNPYMWVRNLMGLMVVLGVALAILRRMRIPGLKVTTNAMDILAIVLLAVIMISGFLLESSLIISEPVFDEMVADYMSTDDPEEIDPLKAYWSKEYGVVFQDMETTPDAQMLEDGLYIHEESCLECHHRPNSAFVSYGLSKLIAPFGSMFNAIRADNILWYIHFIACFAGLASLPFTRFFHIISSPVSLIANGIAGRDSADEASKATRRALALDACTHCGTCSNHCSVGPVFHLLGNSSILPSEKLIATSKMVSGRPLEMPAMAALSDGNHICTNCYRCTTICPAGIDLQDMWGAFRRELANKGYPSPSIRERLRGSRALTGYRANRNVVLPLDVSISSPTDMALTSRTTFSACFECRTCTNVCPVVAAYDFPGEALQLLPHQIMHAMGLGLDEMAMGAHMIWDCVTCYKCQEQCPQGVRVTDVLYGLKNKAWQVHSEPSAAQTANV